MSALSSLSQCCSAFRAMPERGFNRLIRRKLKRYKFDRYRDSVESEVRAFEIDTTQKLRGSTMRRRGPKPSRNIPRSFANWTHAVEVFRRWQLPLCRTVVQSSSMLDDSPKTHRFRPRLECC